MPVRMPGQTRAHRWRMPSGKPWKCFGGNQARGRWQDAFCRSLLRRLEGVLARSRKAVRDGDATFKDSGIGFGQILSKPLAAGAILHLFLRYRIWQSGNSDVPRPEPYGSPEHRWLCAARDQRAAFFGVAMTHRRARRDLRKPVSPLP